MSALGAIFMGDTVVFATDTISSHRTPKTDRNGRKLRETIADFSSKSIYWPHLQTSVAILGATQLGFEYHKFIEEDYSTRAISSFDELLEMTERNFIKFIDRPEIENFQSPADTEGTGFLGTIFLIGLSCLDSEGENREIPIIQAYKIVVYKTSVRKTLMNTRHDELMYCMHPPLPSEIIDKVFEDNKTLGAEEIITGLIIEAKNIYDNSQRAEPLAGGELNFTTMSYINGRLNTSHYTGHRFNDFNEIVDEIKEFTNAREKEDTEFKERQKENSDKDIDERLSRLEEHLQSKLGQHKRGLGL